MDMNHQAKLVLHLVQIFLVTVAIGLSAPRLFMKNQPRTRANTIALGMGAKSLIIIMYQVVTEHAERFRKWKSLKAYAILNCLEVVFWAAVVFLVIQANIQICVGVGCKLSWAVAAIAIVLTILALFMAFVSVQQFRLSRQDRRQHRAPTYVNTKQEFVADEIDSEKLQASGHTRHV